MELKELLTITNDNPSVSEAEFIQRFCPILFNMNPTNREEYLRFVGNGGMPLNVTSNNDSSTVLFTVPGIDLRPTFHKTSEPMLDVMDHIDKMSRINPMQAKAMRSRLKALVGGKAMSQETFTRWTYVVENYNADGKIESTKLISDSSFNEQIDYDEGDMEDEEF